MFKLNKKELDILLPMDICSVTDLFNVCRMKYDFALKINYSKNRIENELAKSFSQLMIRLL